MKKIARIITVEFTLLVAFATFGFAATRTVDNLTDNGALSACTAAANDCSIRGAINAAAVGDTVDFSPSIFSTPQTITLGSELLSISNGMRIIGPGAKLLSVVAAPTSRAFRIDTVSGRNFSISGITFVGGDISNFGNPAGGVIMFGGSGATLSLDGVVLTGGKAQTGGGIELQGGTVSITNSTIKDNTSLGECGGIYARFSSNVTIVGSTISGNSSISHGGGVCVETSTVVMRKSTVAFNSSGSGGGVHAYLLASFTLGDSIVARNSGSFATPRHDIWNEGGGGAATFVDEGWNIIGRLEGTNEAGATVAVGRPNANHDYVGTNNAPVDPRLALLADNGGPTPTHALFAGSVALDHGHDVAGVTTDQRGLSRTFDNIYIANPSGGDASDIGAFEEQTSLNETPFIVANGALNAEPGSSPANRQIATVLDTENTAGVTVAVTSANPSNGVTVSNIVNTNGVVTADISTTCAASTASFTLTATDSGNAISTTTLNVTVFANSPPLVNYPASEVVYYNGSTTVNPLQISDAGPVSLAVLSVSPALITAPTVNSIGQVQILNAQPSGDHVITVRGTDVCGLTTDSSFTLTVLPSVWTVTKTADTDDGTCDSDCSLREAFSFAGPDDTIEFAMPLFDSPQTITLNSPITVGSGVVRKVIGPGADKLTISGGGATRTFLIDAASDFRLSGVRLANGFNSENGGAMRIGGTAVLDRVAIESNSVVGTQYQQGGGIYVAPAANLTLTNSTVAGNSVSGGNDSANRGGGIFADSSSNVVLRNVTVSGNTVSGGVVIDGGGLFASVANVTVTASTFAGNSAVGAVATGGGIASESSTVSIASSIVSNNSAPTNPNLGVNNPALSFTLVGGDSRLAPLAFYGGPTRTHALMAGSEAIDGGDPDYNSTNYGVFDQRGAGRVVGGRLDIGAFESSIAFDQSTLPNASTTLSYSAQLSATRSDAVTGFAPSSFSIVTTADESLPPGITLSPTGLISGTPTSSGTFNFTVKATDTDGQSGAQRFSIVVLAPTAAGVSVSGRLVTSNGNAVANAVVTLGDGAGNLRRMRTNSFGVFSFENVPSGAIYIVGVTASRFTFQPRIISVSDELTDVELIGNE